MPTKNNQQEQSLQETKLAVLIFFMLASVAFLAVAAYAVFTWARTVGNAYPERTLPASAEGTVYASPDTAQFSFRVITEGEDLGALQEQNAQAMNRAVEFLVSLGVSEQDLKTTNYSISPRYQHFRCPEDGGICPPPEIVGYSVNQTAQVKLKNFDILGQVLSGVVDNGANSVSSLSFTVEDPEALREQARKEAMEKAKRKAESVAEAAGLKLGELVSVQESSGPTPVFYREGIGGAEDAAVSVPEIQPGTQELKVAVTLVYGLK